MRRHLKQGKEYDQHRKARIETTEEEFLFNLAPLSSRFVILACCQPLVIVLIVRILFTYPE